MFNAFACVLGVFVILVIAEALWEHKKLKDEAGRKLVHMATGAFVAFWPWFLSWRYIQAIALAFVVVIIISKKYHIFRSIHAVHRRGWGEIGFPLGILLASILAVAHWQFTAAVLVLALADGFAALVGTRAPHRIKYSYKVIGGRKTWAGSLAFFMATTLILAAVAIGLVGGDAGAYLLAATIPLAAVLTVTEAVSGYGIDNFLIPGFLIILTRVVL